MTLSRADYHAFLRYDFYSFAERSFYELNPEAKFLSNWHIELMCNRLTSCMLGYTTRQLIAVPPRNLKSHCATIAFSAWWLGHFPASHVICASYGQDLSDKLARDTRTIMRSPWYQRVFPTRLSDRQAVHDFNTTAQGSRMATSVGGVLTGRGGDLIILDDVLKPEDALSETRRKAANDWYDNTLVSRLNNKVTGCIIGVMQRLHQDDLIGHVTEQEQWDLLTLAAIAEEDEHHVIETPLGKQVVTRRKGEALHPQRESVATLKALRNTMTDYNFSAQYQQAPIPLGGAMVKTHWLRYYEPSELPEFVGILQSWDTANKATDLADYSVCTTWGISGRNFYLLDVFRQRLNYPELKRAAHSLARQINASTVLIEDKASGTSLIQDLRSEGLFGITAYEPPAQTDKIMRLHLQTAMFENGHVHLPRHAPWLSDYIRELTGFPGTKFDDQVDSTAQALHHLRGGFDLDVWDRAFGGP